MCLVLKEISRKNINLHLEDSMAYTIHKALVEKLEIKQEPLLFLPAPKKPIKEYPLDIRFL